MPRSVAESPLLMWTLAPVNILSTQKDESRHLMWVNFQPAFHTHLIQQALTLVCHKQTTNVYCSYRPLTAGTPEDTTSSYSGPPLLKERNPKQSHYMMAIGMNYCMTQQPNDLYVIVICSGSALDMCLLCQLQGSRRLVPGLS